MNDELSDERLTEIERRAEAAKTNEPLLTRTPGQTPSLGLMWRDGSERGMKRADFYCASLSDVPALCRAIRETRAEITDDEAEAETMQRMIAKADAAGFALHVAIGSAVDLNYVFGQYAGDVDAAAKAAVAEIVRLRAEVERLRAEHHERNP